MFFKLSNFLHYYLSQFTEKYRRKPKNTFNPQPFKEEHYFLEKLPESVINEKHIRFGLPSSSSPISQISAWIVSLKAILGGMAIISSAPSKIVHRRTVALDSGSRSESKENAMPRNVRTNIGYTNCAHLRPDYHTEKIRLISPLINTICSKQK